MSINNPNKLVEEFKKSGEFDRIRRELIAQFQSSVGLAKFKSEVEEVARQRLTNDHNLLYMPQEFIHRELMQELDRFPIVERSISELSILNDPEHSTKIACALEKSLGDQAASLLTKQAGEGRGSDTQTEVVDVTQSVPVPAERENQQVPVRKPTTPPETVKLQTDSNSHPSEKPRAAVDKDLDKDPDRMDVDED